MPLPRALAATAAAAAAPASVPAPPAGAGRLLFVSYSHRDMRGYADAFHRYLRLMLRNTPGLGFGEDDVFFDRQGLKAGDDWDQSIQSALERAAVLVLLVSDNSLASRYCVDTELGAAVRRGIPVLPVVLCECPWEGQPLPGDAAGRRLAALQALPKDEAFQLRPVRNWRDRNAAWDAVVDQLAAALRGGAAAAGPAPEPVRPAPGAACALPPLLPYFCDQQPAERAFNQGVMRWRGSALLVLVKGVFEDRPPQFWARLRHKNLGGLAALRQSQVLDQRPLCWPSALDGTRVSRSIGDDVRLALAEALTRNPYGLDGESPPLALAAALQGLGGVLPLMASLPAEPRKALSAGLLALLALLESAPESAPLERLVIAFLVEDEALIAERNLVRRLGLEGHQRTQVVELERLRELVPDDVVRWHRDQELHRWCSLDEHALSLRVFGDAPQLRVAQFEARVKSLLGQGGANP